MSIKRILVSAAIIVGAFSAIGLASASTWTNLPVDGSGNVVIGPTSTLSGNVNVSGTLSVYGVVVSTSTGGGGGGGASTTTANTWTANQTFASSTLLGNASNIYVGTITGDPGTFINSLCNTYAPQATSSLNIYLPAMSSTFSTAINLTQRCNVYGVGPGTHLTWTGAAGTTSTIENFGDSNPHLSGGGVNNLWLDSSGSATTTNAIVGLYLGGTSGAAHSINSGLTISGFGIGLDMGANTYDTGLQDTVLRGNGRDIEIEQSNNSGESDNFQRVFAVDPANSSSSNCVWFKNGSIENLTWEGGSIDNCQLHVGTFNQNVTLLGVNHEEPTYATYGNYDYEVIDSDTHTSFDEIGGNFELVTPTSSSPMNEVISCGAGAVCHYTGGIIYKYANATDTPFFASGGGNLTIDGLYNASAVNNFYSGNASTTTGYYGPFASFGNESITGILGVGSTTASTTNTLTINQIGSTTALYINAGPQLGNWIYASDPEGDTFSINQYGALTDTAAGIGQGASPNGNVAALIVGHGNAGSDYLNVGGSTYIGSQTATTSAMLQIASSTRFGVSGATPGCTEYYEQGATSTLAYVYINSSAVQVVTTTKPSFCQ